MKYLLIILSAFVFGCVVGWLFPSKQHKSKYGSHRRRVKAHDPAGTGIY